MDKVTSSDGTPIAFERLGDGQPVIVVGGATSDRALTRPTAEELAKHFTVFNYDRRGRGDSGDTAPYAVEREIEDIAALIAEAGGTASVYGHSSGAGLALHAAAHGLPVTKLVLHEPPYVPDAEEERRISREYAEKLKAILAEGRRGDAVELFMTTVGMPQEMVDGMRHTPRWAELEAMVPTLAYDSEIMGDSTGGTVPTELVGRVTTETLVLCGGASPAWMIDVGRQVADALPNGRLSILEGQEHVVPPRGARACAGRVLRRLRQRAGPRRYRPFTDPVPGCVGARNVAPQPQASWWANSACCNPSGRRGSSEICRNIAAGSLHGKALQAELAVAAAVGGGELHGNILLEEDLPVASD
jgi:pimeloyl-ACP methyl ester carboxylesterase